MFRALIISTGGTIEKTYCELQGVLANNVSVLDVMLASLETRGVVISRRALMNKDSLEMSANDHQLIAAAAVAGAADHDGIVIVHGTDRLAMTGETIFERWSQPNAPRIPVVLTGAMRPYELRRTDAVQNLTEALLAVQILGAGVYAVLHNKVLAFPGVTKDARHGTFVHSTD
ncbi:MAG: asparaginase [Phycisphaerales bacterium]|nr:asparaginase [Phycisphaerales bacterium]